MHQHRYTLYVAGTSELSARALRNFEQVIHTRLNGNCTLKVVDVLKEPRVARLNRVVATPLLVREQPGPIIKILGDLSEPKIITQLGLVGQGVLPSPQTEDAS